MLANQGLTLPGASACAKYEGTGAGRGLCVYEQHVGWWRAGGGGGGARAWAGRAFSDLWDGLCKPLGRSIWLTGAPAERYQFPLFASLAATFP